MKLLDYKVLGKNIKIVRKARKITQEKLAENVDLSPVFVSQIESGVRKPSLETVYKISKFLNVKVDDLLNQTEKNISNSKIQEFNMLLNGHTEKEVNLILDAAKEILIHLKNNEVTG